MTGKIVYGLDNNDDSICYPMLLLSIKNLDESFYDTVYKLMNSVCYYITKISKTFLDKVYAHSIILNDVYLIGITDIDSKETLSNCIKNNKFEDNESYILISSKFITEFGEKGNIKIIMYESDLNIKRNIEGYDSNTLLANIPVSSLVF